MDLCRVIYKTDGAVSVIHVAPKARRPGETDQQLLNRTATEGVRGTKLEGLPFDDINVKDLPPRDENRDKWRGSKGKRVKIDPSVVTHKEKRQAKEAKLDAEAGKTKPNLKLAFKLQRELIEGNVG